MTKSQARHKLTKFVILALAAASFLMVSAIPASATVYRSVSFNLTGTTYAIDETAWGPGSSGFFNCYGTLTLNSGTSPAHRVGVQHRGNLNTYYSAWTTAVVATGPVVLCDRQFNRMYGEQSTAPSITRNYTLRGNA